MNKIKNEVYNTIELTKTRSAWGKGVKDYALELLENLEEFKTIEELEKELLNGADNWREHSWNGCSLIYDEDIARRLCTPSELKKTRNGQRKPNKNEDWLDVQARALFQAYTLIRRTFKKIKLRGTHQ